MEQMFKYIHKAGILLKRGDSKTLTKFMFIAAITGDRTGSFEFIC